MPINTEVPVYLPGQDLKEAPAFTAPRNWCRIKRAADKGHFVDHSRAFRLVDALMRPAKKIPIGRRFNPFEIFSSDKVIGKLEMYEAGK